MPPPIPLVGIHQLGLDNETDENEIQRRTRHMIARSLNIGRTIAFVGSGVSRSYGAYPSWEEFVSGAEKEADELRGGEARGVRRKPGSRTQLHKADQLVLRLGECEEAVFRARGESGEREFRRRLAKMFRKRSSVPSPDRDPLGRIMKRLRIRRFLTTNYDVEIERAFVRVMGCEPEPLGLGWNERGDQLVSTKRIGRSAAREVWPQHTSHVAPLANALMLEPEHPEFLLQFAVAAPGYEMGVFHCHGICADPDSMVVSERDYQRTYLREDPIHRAYRESLNLAFAANPLLFLGIGLNEPDLLRPLREFVSERSRDYRERPLFALLARGETPEEDSELWRFLYSRYGVKTCFYEMKSSEEPTVALCRAIDELGRDWEEWWSGWQLKPALREPAFHMPMEKRGRVMVHHCIQPRGPHIETRGPFRDECEPLVAPGDIDRVAGMLRGRGLASTAKELMGSLGRVRSCIDLPGLRGTAVVVLGRPGAGKGSLGYWLAMGRGSRLPRYDRTFFGTMHFTNEMLSTIEAAGEFLLGRSRGEGSPFDRLVAALASGRHLVVFGGIERLLVAASPQEVRNSPPAGGHPYPLEIGRPATQEVHHLFEAVSRGCREGLSDVVLTSAILPVAPELDGVPIVGLRGIACSDLLAVWKDLGLNERHVSQLHDALRGHGYALAVLGEALRGIQSDARADWLSAVLRRLTAVDLSRRGPIAIDAALSRHLATVVGIEPAKVLGVVQRLALFPTPVGVNEIVASCADNNTQRSEHPVTALTSDECEEILSGLERRQLVLRVESEVERQGTYVRAIPPRYTAHTLLRQHFLHHLGKPIGEIPRVLSRVGLTAFSADAGAPPVPPPRTPGGQLLIATNVDNLLERIERDVEKTRRADRRLIRAVFGLVRATWSVSAISHQQQPVEGTAGSERSEPAYDLYYRRLVRLTNAVRRTQEADETLWFSRAVDDRHHVSNPKGILYADELGWLYNELGILSYARGSAHDAYALFRIGQDINEIAERGTKGARWCQSELNLAGVHIEKANLQRARYHLENALRGARDTQDGYALARVLGYLGLLNHLSGNYWGAEKLYSEAIENLRAQGNRRGLSIFLRHRGDLRRKTRQTEEARADIADSLVVAESGGHLDLVQYARVAEANLRRSRGDPAAHEVLLPALDFARAVGLPKLEADTLKVQAHVALEHGETEVAMRLALRSLAIGVAAGMQLRVTAGLVLMGRAARVRGDWSAARSILRSAIALGYEQGYQLQIEEADRELMRIPQPQGL